MTLRFQWVNLICRGILKLLTGLIYLSFFLVQFDIHLSGSARDISFFSSDYSSVNNGHLTLSPKHSGLSKESRQPSFKLNKRFHPAHFFTAPLFYIVLEQPLVQRPQAPPISEICPTNLLVNYPSHRGPPAVV